MSKKQKRKQNRANRKAERKAKRTARKDERKANRQERQANRDSRRESRKEAKNQRKIDRISARQQKAISRYENRAEAKIEKARAKATWKANQPHWSEQVANVASGVSDVVGSFFGNNDSPTDLSNAYAGLGGGNLPFVSDNYQHDNETDSRQPKMLEIVETGKDPKDWWFDYKSGIWRKYTVLDKLLIKVGLIDEQTQE